MYSERKREREREREKREEIGGRHLRRARGQRERKGGLCGSVVDVCMEGEKAMGRK